MSLLHKRALITGASGGVGLGVARALAAQGASLVLAGLDMEQLAHVRDEINDAYETDVETQSIDLSQPVHLEALAMECADVDIVVTCHGATAKGSLAQLEFEQWQRAWQMGALPTINLLREFAQDETPRLFIAIIDAPDPQSAGADDICASALGAALGEVIRTPIKDAPALRVVGLLTERKSSAAQIAEAVVALSEDIDVPSGEIVRIASMIEIAP